MINCIHALCFSFTKFFEQFIVTNRNLKRFYCNWFGEKVIKNIASVFPLSETYQLSSFTAEIVKLRVCLHPYPRKFLNSAVTSTFIVVGCSFRRVNVWQSEAMSELYSKITTDPHQRVDFWQDSTEIIKYYLGTRHANFKRTR